MLKIYTGYAWREMKPEEIEIINWQAVHTEEPDNPQAGDIHDQAPYSREVSENDISAGVRRGGFGRTGV